MKYFILKKIMKPDYTGYTKNQASRLIFKFYFAYLLITIV